ncbi:MAG: Rne/Rng family ribonuclease [Ilumatobacteraceae bacterium]
MDHETHENETDSVTDQPGNTGATETAGSADTPHDNDTPDTSDTADGSPEGARPAGSTAKKRRRGSRGGKGRKKKPVGAPITDGDTDDTDDEFDDDSDDVAGDDGDVAEDDRPELPERMSEGRPSPEAAETALVRRPQIGDTRPAPPASAPAVTMPNGQKSGGATKQRQKKQSGQQQGQQESGQQAPARAEASEAAGDTEGADPRKKRRRGGRGRGSGGSGGQGGRGQGGDADLDVIERRKGRERNGRPVGRYMMCVQVRPGLTQVAVLEGRNLIEHYVSRPADDISQIHGNIYVGKVQNVLPGMEAAFVDIGTPKNAVLYRGDVQYDAEDIVEKTKEPRIEQMLKARQLIVCQVTKNPIGAKGARLTQEVSLPGRFVVLIPNSKTYGISKRLPDDVRKRLRNILDRVKPAEHGLIVRTAAEHATEHELRADMTRLLDQWAAIEAKAKKAQGPTLLYREPELAVRVIREEFNAEYRSVVIDDTRLHEDVRDYVHAFNPELSDRIEFYDAEAEGLPLYERFHVHEQIHKALDRKVWLPSGGSLIIEHTEALTVIDVNTGKNVGTTNLEETVYKNNLEAAEEVAKQLRLRDIGGIVVIDFIDMEIKENRRRVVEAFRNALARDKTRTQVFDISELGLVEMTRKRIGEGLLVNFADRCPNCDGRGVVIDHALLE